MNELLSPDTLFRIVDVTGVVANGLLGGVVARAYGYDIIGFLFLAITTGLAGGIMRDVMLDLPPVALHDPYYLSGACVGALIAYMIALQGKASRALLSVADVLALGCWSATGASKALAAGLGWVPAIFLGVLTAVGGGVLRDVLVNRQPAIFGGQPVYASLAIISSLSMVLFQTNGLYEWGMATSIVFATIFGLLARWKKWVLPGAATLTIPRPNLRAQLRRRSPLRRSSSKKRTKDETEIHLSDPRYQEIVSEIVKEDRQ